MKLTQLNDFDCSRTVYQIEVLREEMDQWDTWTPMGHRSMCLSAFLHQLARLAEACEEQVRQDAGMPLESKG